MALPFAGASGHYGRLVQRLSRKCEHSLDIRRSSVSHELGECRTLSRRISLRYFWICLYWSSSARLPLEFQTRASAMTRSSSPKTTASPGVYPSS